MGVHLLSATGKKELSTITMKHTETVNESYHRIFELLEDADAPMDERINKFTRIRDQLFHNRHKVAKTKRELLDAARSIEDVKKGIISTIIISSTPKFTPLLSWHHKEPHQF